MKRLLLPALAGVGIVAGVGYWKANKRVGTSFVNDVVNPWLVRKGLSGSGSRSEIGTLEHFGRRSGTRHLTPLHIIPEPDGIRIMVPLGDRSQWARNVLAAGHCRVQYRDMVVDLDEPRLLAPGEVPGMSRLLAPVAEWLGWEYLVLRRAAEQPGQLEAA